MKAAIIFFATLALLAGQVNAATLLPADGSMGFVNNDACGAAVQAGTALIYTPPTTASAGKRSGYKMVTLAELGKVNGVCVKAETKYHKDVAVYLAPTFKVAVKVDRSGKPVANWADNLFMWKCMNKIHQVWDIDAAPRVPPSAPPASVPRIWYQVEKGVAPVDCQCSIPPTKGNHGGKDFPGAFFPGLEGRECQAARRDFANRHHLVGV